MQVQLASLGLQTLPSLGSLTQFLEQQSLSKVHLLPYGTNVQSLAGSGEPVRAGTRAKSSGTNSDRMAIVIRAQLVRSSSRRRLGLEVDGAARQQVQNEGSASRDRRVVGALGVVHDPTRAVAVELRAVIHR